MLVTFIFYHSISMHLSNIPATQKPKKEKKKRGARYLLCIVSFVKEWEIVTCI